MKKMALALGALACVGCASKSKIASIEDAIVMSTKTEEPVFHRREIIGKSAGEIDAFLGAPALIRREGAGEFRRYTLAQCALLVIFYPQADKKVVATHIAVSAKTIDEAPPDIDHCLAVGL